MNEEVEGAELVAQSITQEIKDRLKPMKVEIQKHRTELIFFFRGSGKDELKIRNATPILRNKIRKHLKELKLHIIKGNR